jgi:hypothetical protein
MEALSLPRDLSANQLIKALKVLGYSIDHQGAATFV